MFIVPLIEKCAKRMNYELHDGVADLVGRSIMPTHVRNNPLIFECLDVKRPKAQPSGNTSSQSKSNTEVTEQKGDLLIRGLCQNGIDSVYGMHVLNTDTKSYLVKTPEKCIQEEERANKKIYL